MSADESRQSHQALANEVDEAARRAAEAIAMPLDAQPNGAIDPMAGAPEAGAANEGPAQDSSPPEEAAVEKAPAASGVPLEAWLGQLLREARSVERSAATGTDSTGPIASLVRQVPVAQLAPGRFQTRLAFHAEAISSLAQSIRARGVLQPLFVRGRPAGLGYEIISGERRWRAAREVGLVEVPVIVLEVADCEAMEIALVDNLQRQDLTPLEEAEGYRRLIEELGETQERLAEVVGKSRSHVANVLRLLRLPEPIKALLADGKLSAGHGRALLSAANPEALARRAVEAGLSVRETERLAQQAPRELGTMPRTVSGWRGRFARERLAGLEDRPHPGPARKYGLETGRRILALLDNPPPKGYARWTGPLLAKALGDVHEKQVWRWLRAQKIDLAGRKSSGESNDPEFVAKAADVVGLYMAPPENAIVISVDEKPSIQALERAPGYLKLPNGRTLTGHSHDYKRRGTSTLFAAFKVATGKVTAAHKTRRRRVEFLDFMNQIVAAYPADTAIHVVIENLDTHTPKNDCWLKLHSNVRFHFTSTRASWLNQVEIWFSILERKSLHGASLTSVKQLKEHIDAFIEAYNQTATPFVWTKAKVRQRRVKGRRISEL